MLLRRCAWHRRFHGYPVVYGVASWRGRSITFTDGVCRSCAGRVRREWRLVERSPFMMSRRFRRIAAGALSVAMLAGTLLSPGPLSDLPSRMAAVNPPTVAVDARAPIQGPVRPRRPRVKHVVKRPPPAPPLDLAEMETAIALADPPAGVVEWEPITEVASVPVEPPPAASQLGTLEDELSRAIIQRASARLLLAMSELPPAPGEHAGSPIQTP
jgi:hypothetical protein